MFILMVNVAFPGEQALHGWLEAEHTYLSFQCSWKAPGMEGWRKEVMRQSRDVCLWRMQGGKTSQRCTQHTHTPRACWEKASAPLSFPGLMWALTGVNVCQVKGVLSVLQSSAHLNCNVAPYCPWLWPWYNINICLFLKTHSKCAERSPSAMGFSQLK